MAGIGESCWVRHNLFPLFACRLGGKGEAVEEGRGRKRKRGGGEGKEGEDGRRGRGGGRVKGRSNFLL